MKKLLPHKIFTVVMEIVGPAMLCISALFCLSSAYSLPADSEDYIILFGLLFSMLFTLVLKVKWVRIPVCLLIFLGLAAIGLWSQDTLRSGLYSIFASVDESFGFNLAESIELSLSATEQMAQNGRMFIWAAASAVITFYYCCCCNLMRTPMLSYIIALPLAVFTMLYLDSPPDTDHIVFMVFSLCLLPLQQMYYQSENPRFGFVTLLLCVFLLGFVLLMRPVAKAIDLSWLETDFFNDMIQSTGSGSSDEDSELDAPDFIDLVDAGQDVGEEVVMRVTSTVAMQLYLRGYSLAAYTGTTFEQPERHYSGSDMPLQFASAAVRYSYSELPAHALTVEYAAPAHLVHTPYFAVLSSDLDIGEGSIEMLGGIQSYIVDFTPYSDITISSVVLPEHYAEEEAAYREYVYENYTADLPEHREFALAIGVDSSTDPIAAVSIITEFLRSNCTYSRTVEASPDGVDTVMYFLNESLTGNCVHYASSTVALLQASGIPARFVGGYMIQVPAANVATEVTASDAHAWVEVYLDGIGWIPFEATFALSQLSPENLTTPSPSPEPTLAPTATPVEATPEPTEAQPTLDPSEQQMQSEEPTLAPTLSPDSTPEPDSDSPDEPSEPPSPILYVLLGLIALVALVIARRFLVRSHRERRMRAMDNNAFALYAYHYAQRLIRRGFVGSPELTVLANKARFSQHKLTSEEREAISSVLAGYRTQLKNMPLLKRLSILYFFALM
ncbi:MAG: transglutaminaseTgpA domain-containing protein [Clostridia bacterium]|nr:transglutaminaseTgpA domain-containing protein [Clostridia bacterium]